METFGGTFYAAIDGVKLHFYDADFKRVPTLQTSAHWFMKSA